ncbi:hypothetical protein CDD81_1405 [Ophiocordyceps australis]|uniref:FAD-binding domain-containing protein n=1 Tax=Ophiocordyceps australis TaxID=1399860 RepID=A0A2C5XTL7_9HYPO|nr:hypothetical protein CDD81_1405 [Ophiocordyceps australis]
MAKSPELYDIVIVGAGPAGLMLATCLVRWGYRIKHIDNRSTSTPSGRADAIQPRYFEVLRELGLKPHLMAHSPRRIYTSAFWHTPAAGGIVRVNTSRLCPDVVDARYPYLTIMHQGLIEHVFLEAMAAAGLRVDRPWTLDGFVCDEKEGQEYPVTVQLREVDGEARQTVKAKYLFSGEGARSSIRQMLDISFISAESTPYIWGVIDGRLETDFPDSEVKPFPISISLYQQAVMALLCVIYSQQGSVLYIPREDNLSRIYVLLASPQDAAASTLDLKGSDAVQHIQMAARKAFYPYTLEWHEVEWFSVYPIKQGMAARYTLDERVFLGGDACHVHSPKMAQGMNTALFDSHNLAWKIHAVQAGFAQSHILQTYDLERRAWAKTLIDYDRDYSTRFSQGGKQQHNGSNGTKKQVTINSKEQVTINTKEISSDNNQASPSSTPAFTDSFKTRCSFASGHGVFYSPNTLIWSPSHPSASHSSLFQPSACTLLPGHQFISATITRIVDTQPTPLDQAIPLNGAFRIYVFVGSSSAALSCLADGMSRPLSFYARFPRTDAPRYERHCPDSRFFTVCTVFAAPREDVDLKQHVPPLLARYRHHVYADDLPDSLVPGARAAAHAKIGLDDGQPGAVVVVRPDGFVGAVVQLVQGSGTVDALNAFFASFCMQ